MKKMLLLLAALLLLCLPLAALASDPAIPADEALVKKLLPDYTLVEGNIHDDELRLLMNKPDGTLVFVGAVQDQFGDWMLAESSPLPEGTILGVENFMHSLGIPSGNFYHILSLEPYADFSWGVSLIYPRDGSMFRLGKDWISDENHAFDGHFGFHPWSNVAEIDWATLPQSYEEAVAALDASAFAVVNNPNPADRLHLRTEPSRSADTQGKFYSGTPVYVTEYGEEWSAVFVAGCDGWMMTEYLAFGEDMESVEYAGPWLDAKAEDTRLYYGPSEDAFYRAMTKNETFFVVGVEGEEWYIIWLPDSDVYAHVKQDDLWPGNG